MTGKERTKNALVTFINGVMFSAAGAYYFHDGGWPALLTFWLVSAVIAILVIVYAVFRDP